MNAQIANVELRDNPHAKKNYSCSMEQCWST